MILNGLKYQKYTSENELQVCTCLYMVYITGWLSVLIWSHDINQGEKSWGVEE